MQKVHIVRHSALELSRSKVKVVEIAFVSINCRVKILQVFLDSKNEYSNVKVL